MDSNILTSACMVDALDLDATFYHDQMQVLRLWFNFPDKEGDQFSLEEHTAIMEYMRLRQICECVACRAVFSTSPELAAIGRWLDYRRKVKHLGMRQIQLYEEGLEPLYTAWFNRMLEVKWKVTTTGDVRGTGWLLNYPFSIIIP